MMNSAGAVKLFPSPRLLLLEERGVLKQLIHKDVEQRRTATLSPGPSRRPFSLEVRGLVEQLIHKDVKQHRTATLSPGPSPLEREGFGERGIENGSKR